uniref:Beta-defensin 130 n=1 Tax=Catagonus wagneri TaxID=51154 RepID=A0A8C3VRT6_9CETA
MRLHLLISLLLFSIIPKARTGIIPGQKQCILLNGLCKDKGCTSTENVIGICNEDKKCCRRWWILLPYPTPAPKSKSP